MFVSKGIAIWKCRQTLLPGFGGWGYYKTTDLSQDIYYKKFFKHFSDHEKKKAIKIVSQLQIKAIPSDDDETRFKVVSSRSWLATSSFAFHRSLFLKKQNEKCWAGWAGSDTNASDTKESCCSLLQFVTFA